MTQEEIKKWIKHAYELGYSVRVVFKGCTREGTVIEVNAANFIMSVNHGAWHHYAAVVSVEPLEPADEPEQHESGILEEDWRYDDGSGSYVGKGIYRVDDAYVVCPDNWEREFAASPDAYRALKMVRDQALLTKYVIVGSRITANFDEHQWDAVVAALKKAGIE